MKRRILSYLMVWPLPEVGPHKRRDRILHERKIPHRPCRCTEYFQAELSVVVIPGTAAQSAVANTATTLCFIQKVRNFCTTVCLTDA